jgi:S-DNA-T family DNA segregation ATPase FtsK/SpoIIIE
MSSKFYRPARTYPPRLPSDEMIINAPPVLQQMQGGVISWLQYFLPLVGILGSIVLIIPFYSDSAIAPNYRFLLIAAFVAMGVSSAGVGIFLGIQQRSTYKKQRAFERSTYLDYLAACRTRLRSVAQLQRQVWMRLYPTPSQLEADVWQRNNLWERRPEDYDFLSVRLGTGPAQLCTPLRLELGNNPMTQFVPELLTQAESLVAEYDHLEDMPIAVPLRKVGTVAINGDLALTHALMRAIICHLVAFHAPEDVRLAAYFPPQMTHEWSWLKWLPHARRLRQIKAEQKYAPDPLCLLASTVEDFRTILIDQIKPELDRRRRLIEDQRASGTGSLGPHLIVMIDGFTPRSQLAYMPELEELFRDAARLGVTVISLVEHQDQEPSLIQARITTSAVGWFSFKEIAFGGRAQEGLTLDATDIKTCEHIARSLTPLTLADKAGQQDLSHDVRLLDLLNIPSADAVEGAQTWRDHTRQSLLQTAIGRCADGEPLILDLKEAAERGMGPHGLIVGATGSGKSELLRTIVTSLAITHDPQTVNFVLVDFKGGASFADFASLPHVAGIITNLQSDASLVDRAYASLLGEQQRRQRMLHEAGNLDNIKQYQARWSMNPEMEPMPHLLMIVDEFAELIANRPDFLDLFITIGRVGRSLGLHLLLATQRIDEGRMKGLEGHLRYRICLRTFSAAESSAVLGNADAYYLPSSPGVGYFKVDTDIYSLFKTALISVPYVPATEKVTPASQIRIFDATGKLLKYEPPTSLTAPEQEATDLHTEMDVVLARLSQPYHSSYAIHQVWLPPLEKALTLESLFARYDQARLDGSGWLAQPPFGVLRIPIGLLDKPLDQVQLPLLLDFSGPGGHLALVGAPQSGKSTLLRTLIASFMVTHSPRDVQFYGLDFGGGLLRIFEQAPHVGAICGKVERDKVRRLVRQMRKIIEDREFLFRERGIDSMTTYRMRRHAGELNDMLFGDVFLVIDNFAQFLQDFDQLEPDIVEIVATGLTYGVHVILATNRWAEIRPKLRDNIASRLELRLNDPIESEIGKAPASAIPIGVPGRGLIKEKLQFQAALPVIHSQADQRSNRQDTAPQQALELLVQRVSSSWTGTSAPPIRMLPSLVTWHDLPATSPDQPSGVPLGLEEFRLDPVYIDLISAGPHFIILGDTECGKTTLLRAWMQGLERRYPAKQVAFAIVDYRKMLLDFAESPYLLTYAYNPATLKACIDNFKVDLNTRLSASTDVPLAQLRKQQRWDGIHFFLFVDDYDTIVTPAGNPFNPLAEMLLAGRDIGFHFVITRRVGGAGRALFEPVIQRLKDMGSSAIIMSGDPQEGKLLHGQAPALLPPGRGYLVQRNQPSTLVQLVCAEPQPISVSE